MKCFVAVLALAGFTAALPVDPPYKPDPYAAPPPPAPYAPKGPPSYVPAPKKVYAKPPLPYNKEEDLPPQPYQFEYGVADHETGANYKATEAQDDQGTVIGSYSVDLPDGRIQTVTYRADAYGGFNAEVTYQGEARFPPEPEEGYGNSYKKGLKKGYAPHKPLYKAAPPPPLPYDA